MGLSWQAPSHACIGMSAFAQTRSSLCFVVSQNSTATNMSFCLSFSRFVKSHDIDSSTVFSGFECRQISVSVWTLEANVQARL